jgi:hypothetical protein
MSFGGKEMKRGREKRGREKRGKCEEIRKKNTNDKGV